MIITLSPSKGQDFESVAPTSTFTQPQQLDQSQILIDAIKPYDTDAIRDLMRVSEKIASLNVARFGSFQTPFTLKNAKQALYAFKGDVYKAFTLENYSEKEIQFAQAHVRVLSGLYGYLRPLDLIQAYRLEMKTKLVNPRGKDLYQFWGERITELLNEDLLKQTDPVLVNLASKEYFKSLKPKQLKGDLININFKETKDGETRIIAIFAKRARGLMANWVIQNKVEQRKQLNEFDLENYRFDAALSDNTQLTFSRPQPQSVA